MIYIRRHFMVNGEECAVEVKHDSRGVNIQVNGLSDLDYTLTPEEALVLGELLNILSPAYLKK